VETPSQSQEPPPPAEAAVPQQEPIVLSKLFPDAKQDLDSLFPDPQMKEFLKEVHKTRQGNQRFLKRLNLSKIQAEEEEPSSEP
jgi:flagellar motor switch protein FliG